MTGPQVDAQSPTTPHIPSFDEWSQLQSLTGPGVKTAIASPTPGKGTTGLTRIPTFDEWNKMQSMTGPAIKMMQLPTLPKIAPSDALSTLNPNTPHGKGTTIGGLAGELLKQIVNPVMENPLTSAATGVALTVPVLGQVVGAAMAGSMVHNIASYGWQKAAEMSLPADVRKFAEADPDRISGMAASVQAAMLGLGSLIHVGVKGYKALDVSGGMVDGAGRAASESTAPTFRPGFDDAHKNADFATDMERGADFTDTHQQFGVRGVPPKGLEAAPHARAGAVAPVEGLDSPEAVKAGKIPPIDTESPAAPIERRGAVEQSVLDYQKTRTEQDLSDLRTADAEKVAMAVRRRPKADAEPAPFFETDHGAETLGAVAARHGLPDDANPYHPDSPRAEAWQTGHANATDSFQGPLQTRVYHGTNAPEFDAFSTEHAGRNDPFFDEASHAGVFFTADKDEAMYFAERAAKKHGGTARVVGADIPIGGAAVVTDADIDVAHRQLESEIEQKARSDPEFDEWTARQDLQNSQGRTSPAIARAITDKMSKGGVVVVRSDGEPDWYAVKNPATAKIVKGAGSFPEGFSMGGALADNRIPPDYTPTKTPGFEPTANPEGASPENAALADALKPSKYRGHTADELIGAAVDGRARLERAQEAVARNGEGSDEMRRYYNEVGDNTAFSQNIGGNPYYAKSPEVELARAKSNLAQIEREAAMRGITGDDLAQRINDEQAARAERAGMADDAPAQDAGSTTEPGHGLVTTEGAGPTRVRGLAHGIAEHAVANKLGALGELPEYRSVNMADQAVQASDLLQRDPALARAIAMGQAQPPTGMLPEAVLVAVENKATAEGDVATLRDLATGKLTEAATSMGQRIRALGERDPDSPVSAMQQVERVRAGGADVPRATEAVVASLRKKLQGSRATLDQLQALIDEMKC